MKEVYVFFFETQFKIGKAIRLATRNKYSHVALSFEPNTHTLYSYARYRYSEPILGGFGIEYTDRYALFGEPVDIKVCKVQVTDAHYYRIKAGIEEYMRNMDRTHYNFFDLFTYPLHRHVELQYTHTCLSFLLERLELPDIHSIAQLEEHLKNDVVYEGLLSDFEDRPSSGPVDFFERRRRRVVAIQSALALLTISASLVKKLAL